MAESPNDNEIKLSTPIGPIWARGSAVFIVLALGALTWLTFHENEVRSVEHDEIIRQLQFNGCLTKLALYQYLSERGRTIDFATLPPELYNCIPKFVSESRQK